MHQPLMSLRRFGAFLRSNAAASARDWQSQSPPARKCPLIPSWTLIDVPTTGSILIYSHFVQTVLTSRLLRTRQSVQQSLEKARGQLPQFQQARVPTEEFGKRTPFQSPDRSLANT